MIPGRYDAPPTIPRIPPPKAAKCGGERAERFTQGCHPGLHIFRPSGAQERGIFQTASTRAAKNFVWEKRLDAILATIKAGDYLLIQFGHNDQKPESPAYVEPFTTYQEALKIYIDAARSRGAYPILATSIQRRFFDEQGKIMNTHGDYPEAVRQLAAAEQIPLIDLHALSKVFFEALGQDASQKAFVHCPAGSFPGQDEDLYDNTHFSEYGAYELARLAAQAMRDTGNGLAQHVVDDLPAQNLRK